MSRKPKWPKRKPQRMTFNPRAQLRPVAWGTRDAALGRLVCRHLDDSMPPTPWSFTRKHSIAPAIGWLIVAVGLVCILAGAAR